MPRASPMEAMSSGAGHLGKDNDTMGTNIIEPRAQPVLHGEEHQPVLGEDDHQPVLVQEEHQPVLGEDDHQPVLFQEEPQLVAEEQHEPDKEEPKRVSVAPKTLQEAAAAAGVVTMVRDDEVVFNSSKKRKHLWSTECRSLESKKVQNRLTWQKRSCLRKPLTLTNLVCSKDTPNMERRGIS